MNTPSAAPSPDAQLVIVNTADQVLGQGSWNQCHQGGGLLHRALSVFIFNPLGEVLLQRRSKEKGLWPLFWSNACCTHPRIDESCGAAAKRRLKEELGIEPRLTHLFRFSYHARSGDWSERELCTVFAGVSGQQISANAAELCDWRWIGPEILDREIECSRASFTPWALQEWDMIRSLACRLRWIGVEAR